MYQVDPNRFTNVRVRELDTALVTDVTVSQTHFIAWSKKEESDSEPEEETEDVSEDVERNGTNIAKNALLSSRVLGSPFTALQQLNEYLRDFIRREGIWTSGLDPNCM